MQAPCCLQGALVACRLQGVGGLRVFACHKTLTAQLALIMDTLCYISSGMAVRFGLPDPGTTPSGSGKGQAPAVLHPPVSLLGNISKKG